MKYLLRRFLSYYIDGICILLLSLGFYILQQTLFLNIELMEIENISNSHFIPIYLITSLLYFFLLELSFGKTIGKICLKLKVSGLTNLLFKQRCRMIFIRTISRLIPLEQFSIFFNEKEKMWHDSLSNTSVVEIKK